MAMFFVLITKMSWSDDYVGVVIDTGSQCSKAGFAAETTPRTIIPTSVGRFRRAGIIDGLPLVYCGKDAIKNQGISNLVWPVQDGLIKDWDEMEKLWHHLFYRELHVPPEGSRVMHAVHSLVPRKDKETIAEIMFESFAVQGLYLVKAPVAVLHASGRTSGLVWQNGFSSSHITPVYEGFPLKHSTVCSSVTGDLLTDRLQRLMAQSGYSFTTPFERGLLERIKAQLCYVAQDYPAELESHASSAENMVRFELPDGQHILLGEERFQCPECLFKPSLESLDNPGLPDLICTSVSKCDLDYRSLFYENIVISGGSSMFPGLVKRLTAELNRQAQNLPGSKINIDAMPSRQFLAWAGASLLASLNTLKGFWFTRAEYEDAGPEGVSYKFF